MKNDIHLKNNTLFHLISKNHATKIMFPVKKFRSLEDETFIDFASSDMEFKNLQGFQLPPES